MGKVSDPVDLLAIPHRVPSQQHIVLFLVLTIVCIFITVVIRFCLPMKL